MDRKSKPRRSVRHNWPRIQSFFIDWGYSATKHLQDGILSSTEDEGKVGIIQFFSVDENVQFYWSMIAADIEDDVELYELLKGIVELWLNIRGFSISKMWMEKQKVESRESVRQKKV